ncbi:MAG: Gfo/Idh/MocA family oxidoreductase [Pirellulaceae bacterium]|nr:Gfo/Idh/MocA family oxidoreductase [Pirellulaceae bacterium]
MLKSAIVGVGFMGWMHYLAYQRSSGARLAAFCSRDAKKRSGDWSGIRGNFGPPGQQIDVSQLKVYQTLDEILRDPDIDVVDICLPPSLHVTAACRALEAGKHVFCEKPLGLNTHQCDQILATAHKYGRHVLVAQVLPYMGQFQYAYQAVQQGTYGRPLRAHLKRVISPPDWIPDFYNPDTVGGPLIDLHVHDAHFICLLFGMPRRVVCSATMHNGLVKFCHTLMEFDEPGVFVATSCGVTDQQARPFCHGFELHCQQAVMQFELSVQPHGVEVLPLSVLHQDGTAVHPELPGGDDVSGFCAEIEDMAASIKSGQIQPRLSVQHARDAIHICQCLQQSAQSGQWVHCQ